MGGSGPGSAAGRERAGTAGTRTRGPTRAPPRAGAAAAAPPAALKGPRRWQELCF